MRLLFTGGGTGGHLYPGLAIAEEFGNRISCQILYVGTKRGLEASVIPEKGYRFQTVWVSGFQRGEILKNVLFPVKVAVSLIQALFIVGCFHPDVILGTGGYVSWPVLMAGVLMRKKIVIQEQNWMPGIVTRILAPFADSVYLSFESSRKFLRKKSNLRVSGNPTREGLDGFSRDQSCCHFQLDGDKTTLFVFGGSQGARAINQAVLKILERLMERKNIQILWATGPRWIEEIKNKTKIYGTKIRAFPYIRDMGMAYRASDVIVCRAGATTVAEVTRLGLAVIFIPLPGAAEGHQKENARILNQANAAEVVLEEEIDRDRLAEVVFFLLDDPDRRRRMGERAKMFGKPDAARIIVEDILMQWKVSKF